MNENKHVSGRVYPWISLVAALFGLAFVTIQIMEKITILKNPSTSLVCDVSAKISCTNVLNAWQSSVMGPPNPFIGAIMFSFLAAIALAFVLKVQSTRAFILVGLCLAVFFLGFVTWYFYQTAFVISSLCLWCTGIATAVVIICAAFTRILLNGEYLAAGKLGDFSRSLQRTKVDLVVWFGWWLLLAGFLYFGIFS